MAKRTSSVTIGFSADSDDGLGVGLPGLYGNSSIRLEAIDKSTPEPYQQWIRCYPAAPEILRATTGFISNKTIKIASNLVTVLVYVGTDFVSMPYPGTDVRRIEMLGRYLDKNGDPISVSFTYDRGRAGILSSKPVYGLIEVEYDVPYMEFLFTWTGGSCPSPNSGSPIPPESPFDDSVIVAINLSTNAAGTLQLAGPMCKTNSGNLTRYLGPNAEPPTGDIIIDPDYPPQLDTRASTTSSKLTASCRLRFIPGTSVNPSTVKLTSGKLDFTVDEGLKSATIEEVKAFGGNGSTNLSVIPAGSLSFEADGVFIDQFGGTETAPNFAGPGTLVYEADWSSSFAYGNLRSRIVRADELVCVNSFNVIKPMTGVVRVSYSYTYSMAELQFEYVEAEKRFRDVYVSTIEQVNTDRPPSTLRVPAPQMQGVS